MAPKGKRKRETAEDIINRPFCYYCDRDFDDLRILVDHQRAKHFQCISNGCHRRLNTVGGLKVHMQQVHKEELLEVPNAIEGRKDINVEIFGSEGIPGDMVQRRRELFLAAVHKEQVEYFQRTGNHLPGSMTAAEAGPPAKKPAAETTETIKAKAKLAKAKLMAKRAAQAAAAERGEPFDADNWVWVPPAELQVTPTPNNASNAQNDSPEPRPADSYAHHASHALGNLGLAPPSSSPAAAQPSYPPPAQNIYGPAPQSSSPVAAQQAYPSPGQPLGGTAMANGFPAAMNMNMQQMPQNMMPIAPGMPPMSQSMPNMPLSMPSMPPGMFPPGMMSMPQMPMSQFPVPSMQQMQMLMAFSSAGAQGAGLTATGGAPGYAPYSPSPVNGSNLPGLGGSANLPRRPPPSAYSGPPGTQGSAKSFNNQPPPSGFIATPNNARNAGSRNSSINSMPSSRDSPNQQAPTQRPGMSQEQLNELNRLMDASAASVRASNEAKFEQANQHKDVLAVQQRSEVKQTDLEARRPSNSDSQFHNLALYYRPKPKDPTVGSFRPSSSDGPTSYLELYYSPKPQESGVRIPHPSKADHDNVMRENAVRQTATDEPNKPRKKKDSAKKDTEQSKQLLTDNEVSWEEKRAMAPRYGAQPRATNTIMGDVYDAVTGVVDDEMS